MADNTKFVFVSGVPGSSWSMISHRLKLVKDLDCSDVTDNRQFTLPVNMSTTVDDVQYEVGRQPGQRTGKRIVEGDKSHFGCYFGPYNEFGDGFDDIPANYTLDQFYQECARPFENNEKAKCVRSARSSNKCQVSKGNFTIYRGKGCGTRNLSPATRGN